MEPQLLITTLKEQHRTLQQELAQAAQSAVAAEALAALNLFRQNLTEHVKFESNNLYRDYLQKQKAGGIDTTSTVTFIEEMNTIYFITIDFLNRYPTAESITSAQDTFQRELNSIIGTLNIRINAEEEGVFEVYLTM